MIKEYKILLSTLFVILIAFVILWQIPEFRLIITGKYAEEAAPTTLNVTIGGLLGSLQVSNIPINFTLDDGLLPLEIERPKQREPEGVGYITVKLNASNNANYNIYMNASNLQLSGNGVAIPASNISVNCTCNGSTGGSLSLTRLSTSLLEVCTGVYRYNSTDIYFYIDIPAGQDNGTYFGDVWIYVNSSEATGQNHTWYGPSDTTVAVQTYIEFMWNSSNTPVKFGTLDPGAKSNATTTPQIRGWPASLISGARTNIFIDIYLNATDLDCIGGVCTPGTHFIGLGNVTYSNATSEATWPDTLKVLNKTLPDTSTNGDFDNWGHVKNRTNTYSWWNISIPSAQQPGDYGGILYAKATEESGDPTA